MIYAVYQEIKSGPTKNCKDPQNNSRTLNYFDLKLTFGLGLPIHYPQILLIVVYTLQQPSHETPQY